MQQWEERQHAVLCDTESTSRIKITVKKPDKNSQYLRRIRKLVLGDSLPHYTGSTYACLRMKDLQGYHLDRLSKAVAVACLDRDKLWLDAASTCRDLRVVH